MVDSVKNLEMVAAEKLRGLLAGVPVIQELDVALDPAGSEHHPDIVARFSIGHRAHTLLVEMKASDQPRMVQEFRRHRWWR